jgi:hypothetical protein
MASYKVALLCRSAFAKCSTYLMYACPFAAPLLLGVFAYLYSNFFLSHRIAVRQTFYASVNLLLHIDNT